ncbi:tetratricopeptide repeat protein [Pseudomonas sp. LPB0260]|uniref:O-linked N-acetylglucosamine transferase, SPINDLY family protein n=1 Tax=Pseudomonas sp. LPB0260 TaxID=2614442 RepID=UPI0015C21D5D|nr:tetratricopeptide repeat protein [Pseudomonas sp. LPB0260]QLC73745.1 tetratricopeptide repeat protein [Pseudomonas sp. LPB0260]QLC76519.1 tetratricopeptide repeat protein [Pseudomonas sp. LPB0260]
MPKKNQNAPAGLDFTQATQQAWEGRLNLLQLLEIAGQFSAEGRNALAAVLYQTWLKRNQTTHNHLAYFNLGVILFSEGDLAGAKEAYSHALGLAPQFLQPRFNLGLVYERQGQHDAATAQWLWIEAHANPTDSEQRPLLLLALNNLGRHYEEKSRYAEALSALTKSLRIEPNQPDVIHHWVFLRAKQCCWPVYQSIDGISEQMFQQSTSALAMISLSEDPQAQLEAARQYVSRKVQSQVPRLAPKHGYGHRKLRIGYCSSDFCLHPVAMLTVELFELHDRDQFEIYGFDWSREDGSALRQRVIKAMDHFEHIHALSDEAAAQLIRQHEIDILIDLQGQTLGARAGMLAYRPAPIQITYLGLPATTGLPSIDYVIADRFLIPESAVAFYSEKPLYLPDVYQVSDRQRQSAPVPSRESCGLPPDAFVFCSFNNNYKYTPEMFRTWMRILGRVPGSVLWLLADNPWAEANLRQEALACGIDEQRLIFASRTLPEQYLARYGVADLFLDCYPFNGGTTANDALWMGLPVLTRSGQTFASRMAGALLTAAGLDELITYDLASYEEKAVALANSTRECQRLRAHLQHTREQGALFDTPRLTRNLEKQFKTLHAELA